MNLANFLHEDSVQMGLKSLGKKSEIIKEIATVAKKNPLLADISVEEIAAKLTEREDLGSTGFENGVAIPHCTLDNLTDFVIGIIIDPKGVDYDSVDGKKTQIFTFIIAPESKRNDHIRALSIISRVLHSRNNIKELLSSKDPSVIVESFLRHTDTDMEVKTEKHHNMLTIVVQKESIFEDVLNILTEADDCYISIVDAEDASSQLYKTPLFASIFNEDDKGYHKVIFASIRRTGSNDIIRRINMIIEDLKGEPGIMLMMNEVTYFNGSLNL